MAAKIKEGMTGGQVADIIEQNFENLEDKFQQLSDQFDHTKEDLQRTLDEYQEQVDDAYGSLITKTDEEDTTTDKGKIKLKDRAYDPDNFSGKGYKILRKNIVCNTETKEAKNILTQDMINEANTVYEIRYDFDLNGQEITIPNNCVLKFNGGSLRNGLINGNNINISSSPIQIFYNINFADEITFANNYAYSEWLNKDIKKTLELFNIVNFIGNYVIDEPIEISSYDKWYKLIFENNSNFSVNENAVLDYVFIFRTYCNYQILGSINHGNLFKRHIITGPGNINLSGRCGFINCVRYDGDNEDIRDIGLNIYNIQINGIGKSIDKELKTGNGVSVASSSIITNVQLNTNRLATDRSNEYNIPYVVLRLNGGDHKINRLTIITPYIGIGSIAGDSVLNDVHVWGAPKIAFNVVGRSTFINCYADYAYIHYKINGIIPINILKTIGIGDSSSNEQCLLGFRNHSELLRAGGIVTFSSSSNKSKFSITGIVDEETDSIKEKVNIVPTTLDIKSIDDIELFKVNPNLNITLSDDDFIWIPICIVSRTFPKCSFIIKPDGTNSQICYVEANLADNIFYFKSNSNIDLNDCFKTELVNISNTNYWKVWYKLKHNCALEIKDCFAFLCNQATGNINTELTGDYTSVVPINVAFLSGATINRPLLTSKNIGQYYFDNVLKKPIWWNGTSWVNSEGNNADSTPITSGTFANKPTGVDAGYAYFCTDKQTTEGTSNGIMIYYKGNNVWVDALGRVIS